MWEEGNSYVIGGNVRRKETTRKTKTWVDNIKMILGSKMGWFG
jgi:hypothetical protein